MLQHILVVLSILATFSTGVPRRGRIVGGQDAAPGQFPFAVAINDPDQWCDGAIVAPSWILTAAQCIYYLTPSAEVYIGSHLNQGGGTAYRIEERIVHSDFDDYTYQHDIGLLKIDGVLEFGEAIQAIEIGEPADPNATCTAIGWGQTETDPYPENLKFVDLTVIDLELCQTVAGDYLDGYYLGPEQLCTLGAPGLGACYGDNGGPLVCDGMLAGVVSYTTGLECGEEMPDVYTRTAAYAEWIQAHIQG